MMLRRYHPTDDDGDVKAEAETEAPKPAAKKAAAKRPAAKKAAG